MTRVFLILISIYQKFVSPDHSFWAEARFPYGYCRFAPSCSEYLRQAVLAFGFSRGLAKALGRLLRCHPFSAGGYDPVAGGK